MKKTVLSITLTILAILSSCSEEGNLPEPVTPRFNGTALTHEAFRSPEEAIQIAQNAISLISGLPEKSRNGETRRIDNCTPIQLILSNTQKGGRSNNEHISDTLMYVVNYEDERGFAIVSRYNIFPELIAVTEAGHYNSDKTNEMPAAFNFYMDEIKSCMSQILTQVEPMGIPGIEPNPLPDVPFLPRLEEKIEQDTIWHKNILELVTVQWGQRFPYGDECPNKVAGCSNTAVAMLLSYYEYPQRLTLNYISPSKNIDIDWQDLKRHKQTDSSCYTSCPNDRHKQIAQICREIGYRSSTNYKSSPAESSTSIGNTLSTLKGLGFVKAKRISNEQYSINHDFDRNNLCLVSGYDASMNVGHMWLCDGLKSYSIHYKRYIRNAFQTTWTFDKDWMGYTMDTYHYNWGWDGFYNGFFTPSDFTVKFPSGEIRNYSKNVEHIKVPRP